MSIQSDILAAAHKRIDHAAYAGAVTPQEAQVLLETQVLPASAGGVKLIDVRTNAERDWIGKVAIDDARHGAVQWNTYPGGAVNPDFLEQLAAVANKDDVLLFLCRSGVRSRHAAKLATDNGYLHCYDILEGFEGDKDQHGHRKHVGGWCKAGLPWIGA